MFGRKPSQSSSSTSTSSSKVSRRRGASASPDAGADDATVVREGSKGHPTPKRREAERGRRRATTAPRDRKTAYRETRERQREDRTRQMHALKAGDERHLPARDRGPVRKYARDLVDTRRSVAEFFLPLALVILIVLDSVVLAYRLRRGLARSLPDVSHKGATAYALMRSMQIRRFRLPPPRIKGRGFRRPS